MDRKELLEKVLWTTSDIQNYFNVTKQKALKIKNLAIENGGGVTISIKYVKTDSVLALFGTTRKEEKEYA